MAEGRSLVAKRHFERAPATITKAGGKAVKRYWEFFAANIRNKNTRLAYARALSDFFSWCDDYGVALIDIEPITVAAYVEYLATVYSNQPSNSI
ncbi:MAG: hypothetical protein U0930_12455 [Pirellulales bacterium]